MTIWRNLFIDDLEYAPAADILAGLTLEQVGARSWCATQHLSGAVAHGDVPTLDEGTVALDRWELEEHFPKSVAPVSQAEWDQLVADFLAYSERAVRQAEDKAWLESPEGDETAWTWRNGLEFLAVHNAYHLRKIVSLRQLLGV